MGGRRRRTITEIIGSGVPGIRAFNNALESGADANAVVERGTRVLEGSGRLTDVLYYLSRLASAVTSAAESSATWTDDERSDFARREWSALKQREQIADDPVTNRAIIDAIAKALKRGRR